MEKPNDKIEAYRKMAADCIEVAQRMSLKDDRARMMEMAQRWLDLAQQAETPGG
jgi:putative IMPACT (imprinted ancient) family translation regulator